MRQSAVAAVIILVIGLGAALLTPVAAAVEARRVTPPGAVTVGQAVVLPAPGWRVQAQQTNAVLLTRAGAQLVVRWQPGAPPDPRTGLAALASATRQAILLAVLVLGIVAVPQTSLVIQRLVQSEPQAGTVTLLVWGLYALPLLAAILTVDYFEREPWWLVGFALAWGGLVATGLALSANAALQSILTTSGGLSFTAQWGAAIAGPTNEEVLKGLGVVVGTLLAGRRMRSPVDGFILGAVVGLGFQVVEDVVYTANVMFAGQDPWSALGQMFVLRGIMGGLWSHAVYTGLFGLGLGYALTRVRWPLGLRVLAAVAGFVAAWSLHFLWNS